MAFMGRGGGMSSSSNNIGGDDNNYIHHYRWHHIRSTYIPLDSTYVLMQMVITFIILIVGSIVYLFAYKSPIVDPIENIKNVFMNVYSVVLLILLVIVAIVNFFSKSKETLIKKLAVTLVISIATMLIFLGIKLNYDSTYDKNKFEQFYLEQNIQEKDNNSKVDIGISGLSIKTEKEYYIDKCMEVYNIFKIKSYAMLISHLLLNILLIYQIFKLINIEGKKDKLDKDDLILFDEEQNVRF